MELKTYTKRERNMYMTGMAGQNIIYNIINGAFTTYFMKDILFIPAAVVSIILVAAQVWDAFNDPMMGTIVDRTRSKWGKCRPYLLFVPVINGVVTILCFLGGRYGYGPDASTMHNFLVVLWAAGFYILWGMTYTAGDIPLWGISALMTEDEKHRQKLQSYARIAAGIGTGVVVLGFQPLGLAMGGVIANA
ncbi:MAG: MFS transporter, partial [Oscillospiraceae bacterium]|nr:MFS transporter [Oscillospiraceae bacterium]